MGGASALQAGIGGFPPKSLWFWGWKARGLQKELHLLSESKRGYFSFPFLMCGVWEKAVRRRDGAGRGKSELGEERV